MTDEENQFAHVGDAASILPAWFVPRMMDDVWYFGVALTNGTTLVAESISGVSQAANGDVWVDFNLHQSMSVPGGVSNPFFAPTSRTKCSVNAAHIVAVFELADT